MITQQSLAPFRIGMIVKIIILVLLLIIPVGCQVIPGAAITYEPNIIPVAFTVDSDGTIHVEAATGVNIPAIGRFSVSGGLALEADDRSLLVIIRDRRRIESQIDTVYRIPTGDAQINVVLDGHTLLEISNRRVVVDVTDGSVQRIDIRGSAAEMPPERVENQPSPSSQATSPSDTFSSRSTIDSFAWSPDGKTIAVAIGFSEYKIVLWNVDTGNQQVLATFEYHIWSLSWSPDGESLATAADNEVCVWNVRDGTNRYCTYQYKVKKLAWSPDGQRLAAGMWYTGFNGYGQVLAMAAILDARNGHTLLEIEADFSDHQRLLSPSTSYIFWSADGSTIIGCTSASRIYIWDSATGQPLHSILVNPQNENYSVTCSMSPSSNMIANEGSGKTIQLWSSTDGNPSMPPIQNVYENLWSADWSPDGHLLATVYSFRDNDQKLFTDVQIWRIPEGSIFKHYQYNGAQIMVQWRPDGQVLAIAGHGISNADSGSEIVLWHLPE